MRIPHLRLLHTRLAIPLPHGTPRLGPPLVAAIDAHLAPLGLASGRWLPDRRAVAALQSIARADGIDPGPIDGLLGPQTEQALARLLRHDATDRQPGQDGTALAASPPQVWPTESGVTAFYGPHGTPDGRRPPLVRVQSPWTFRIAWNPSQTRTFLWAHEKTAASVGRILSRIHLHYGAERIRDLRLDIFSGDYDPRLMRGSRTRWSMHAWGIAYDFDDTRNRLHWGADRASLARPEYRPFWEIWESEGWVSLGRTRNNDWMHVQAARPDRGTF